MIRSHQVDKFITAYERHLAWAVCYYPDEYAFPFENVPLVVERMRHAFYEGSYNHDGRAIKATCGELGIGHSRKAMEAFFNTNPEAVSLTETT